MPRPHKEKTIRVGVFRPGKAVEFWEIHNQLADMQVLVDGYIEQVCISDDLVVVCNEEGKIKGLPNNRLLLGPYDSDMLAGTFFVARTSGPEYISIQPQDEALLKAWVPGAIWSTASGKPRRATCFGS